MKLENFASEITAENAFIKASFGGFAGSGKTRTASEFIIGAYKALKCSKPILIIDNEKGSRFLVPLFEKAGIKTLVKDTLELADVLTAFGYLNKGEIDFLFVDSLTKIWYKYIRDYRSKNGNKAFMTLQDWGKILPAWQESFADKFVNLSGNCVFTGRGGYTYDMEENDRGKKEFVKSGVKMKMAGETPFEPDLNIWMEACQTLGNDEKPEIWREGMVLKDRSGLIDGKTFKNPKYKDFAPVVDYLLNVPKGDVKKATSEENLAPHEEWSDNRKQKDIYLEKALSEFDKRQFGTSKDDRAMKVKIIEKVFETTSWEEIKGFKLDKIQMGYNRLIDLFVAYDQAEDKAESINKHEFSLLLTFA